MRAVRKFPEFFPFLCTAIQAKLLSIKIHPNFPMCENLSKIKEESKPGKKLRIFEKKFFVS